VVAQRAGRKRAEHDRGRQGGEAQLSSQEHEAGQERGVAVFEHGSILQ
jgi:hypothetical protein